MASIVNYVELLEGKCNIAVIAAREVSNKERSPGKVLPHNHSEVERLSP